VPRKGVTELQRLLEGGDRSLELEVGRSHIRVKRDDVSFTSKLIDGRFPDYEAVIPIGADKGLRINRAMLLSSMSRVAILTNEKFRGVRLVLSPGSLKIMAANAEQEEAQEELEVEYDGDAIDIGFYVGYLLDVLNNSSAEAVQWGLNDSNSSALVTIPENDRFKYVVMPMRI